MRHDNTGSLSASTSDATLDPRLLLVSASPLNAETRLALHHDVVTPNAAFYVRNHFPAPQIDAAAWRLEIGGEVAHSLVLTIDQIRALPARTLRVTLECAGNGRSAMQPQPPGEPWQYGAVSSGEWIGVPLPTVLELADLTPSVSNIVVEGADGGYAAEAGRTLAYERGLPRAVALHPDTLLAYTMNGEALPVEHGFPLRLIVPGWYGMASVKWVTHITARSAPFNGFYQADRYVLRRPDGETTGNEPLTRMRIRSLIAEPATADVLPRGEHRVRGFAWSGHAPISRVEVSVNGGATWEPADLTNEPEPYLWRPWEYRWQAALPGQVTLASRAFDAGGNQQPAEPVSNRLGYANNAIRTVPVVVE